MVQASTVLLSDVVIGGDFADPVQDRPGIDVAAQLDQRFYQAVHGFNVVGKQLQNRLIDFGGPFPFAAEGMVDGLTAEVPLQFGAPGCLSRFRVHPVSCLVMRPLDYLAANGAMSLPADCILPTGWRGHLGPFVRPSVRHLSSLDLRLEHN